jgi:hypothetical protein
MGVAMEAAMARSLRVFAILGAHLMIGSKAAVSPADPGAPIKSL